MAAWFGPHRVLEDVSLTMLPGQVTSVIGPSGCGKSTFLRILNRMHLLEPGSGMAGHVRLDGREIYDSDLRPTDCRLDVGMVFQRPDPFTTMSVAGNILAGPRIAGLAAGHPDRLVHECLTRAGLWAEVAHRLNDPAGTLSLGQQQRLCIARALAVRPRVLLMDEPCSALDPTSTAHIEATIRELRRDVTTIIATHNLGQAMRVSDQCAFFFTADGNSPGRIIETGPTAQIFASPAQRLTASYLAGDYG